ncbi:hypothetical protein SAMN02927900_04745 [Rhizobium mongolense subsp. loessense]|uniref:HEPN domain-containing protein n=1 Tax=Rhizobium mongolense subsp. loessense TaxID=158890 RepID=A0A1G4T698_9HYPH|nr:hypothetical protein [Rhizobium mongolense]SCW76980.1 hypothetical protein SAMN02927900_04745 [Rhizobium mongolense subsp. loessense]
MLVDIFTFRYKDVRIWDEFTDDRRRLFVQASRLLTEQLFPLDIGSNPFENRDHTLKAALRHLAMELGVNDFDGTNSNPDTTTKGFLQARPLALQNEDTFIKDRVSLIELVFRYREQQIERENAKLPEKLKQARLQDMRAKTVHGVSLPGSQEDRAKNANDKLNKWFSENVNELNVRLARADMRLAYHAGYFQFTGDNLVEEQIRQPFWKVIDHARWANVEVDMLEALDRSDKNGRDPSLYASKALESTLKIISGEKGWTSGKEPGAASFVQNLKKNGYLKQWEEDILLDFFRKVRNPHGHGPGGEPMPQFSLPQNEWAIDTCMGWIKSLVSRF